LTGAPRVYKQIDTTYIGRCCSSSCQIFSFQWIEW